MTRREAVALLAAAILALLGGLGWQFGGWGLIGGGLAVAVLAVLLVDVKDEGGGT